LDRADILTAIP